MQPQWKPQEMSLQSYRRATDPWNPSSRRSPKEQPDHRKPFSFRFRSMTETHWLAHEFNRSQVGDHRWKFYPFYFYYAQLQYNWLGLESKLFNGLTPFRQRQGDDISVNFSMIWLKFASHTYTYDDRQWESFEICTFHNRNLSLAQNGLKANS